MSCLIWGMDQGSCAWVLVPSFRVSLLNLMLQGSLRGIWFHRAFQDSDLSAEGSTFLGGTPVFSGIELEIQDGAVCKRGPVIFHDCKFFHSNFDYKFLLRVCLYAKSLQPCSDSVTPWIVAHQAPLSMECSRRILEWVAISFSRGSFQPRDGSCVSCIGRWILYHLSHLGSPHLGKGAF